MKTATISNTPGFKGRIEIPKAYLESTCGGILSVVPSRNEIISAMVTNPASRAPP